ncbi:hypothetical protein FB472_1224 [Rhodoglobus vestalii]|uniref:Uncharacterized protein n=1 Tax=Rhodoglobus vestalii TaxID=193384 RepID=A0A8H2K6E8_9MICO|nr:hypothetical protein [Rhodoglobus vestalii]TQO19653.1 hypothetical protein FB472_1224 [Rhodoglobus vestalii]
MTQLTSEARATLRNAGFTSSQWARLHGYSGATDWRGDVCGCTDDRCIGHHHDATDACGCLPALIEDHRRQQRASAAGREVWAAHVHATETGTEEDRATAGELASSWITEYHPNAISHSLTESPKGITCRNHWNETTWLIFDAERGQVSTEAMS